MGAGKRDSEHAVSVSLVLTWPCALDGTFKSTSYLVSGFQRDVSSTGAPRDDSVHEPILDT